ncbi:MAG: RNA polymerase sigma factor [Limisphaerales bacterium]
MNKKLDAQLLREYVEDGNEDAFREVVLRHTDLIYSAALRQVTSPDLARDVTQSVFIDLARKAKSLAQAQDRAASLVGWLYRGTQNGRSKTGTGRCFHGAEERSMTAECQPRAMSRATRSHSALLARF